MTRRDELDERAAALAWRALDENRWVRGGADEAEMDDELRAEVRAYTDLLGLLPSALEELAPRPEVKTRLMAAVRGAEGGGAGADDPGPPRWFTTLAASLLVAVLGLGALCGWLYGRVSAQQATIGRLSRELSLVSTPGVEVCPLRPMDAGPSEARGLLFLSGPRDRWYVRVANVGPAPEGRVYRVWFVVDDEYHPMGVLRAGAGDGVDLSGTDLPPAERMTAALVTLEPANAEATHPTGPPVLFGDERMPMI